MKPGAPRDLEALQSHGMQNSLDWPLSPEHVHRDDEVHGPALLLCLAREEAGRAGEQQNYITVLC